MVFWEAISPCTILHSDVDDSSHDEKHAAYEAMIAEDANVANLEAVVSNGYTLYRTKMVGTPMINHGTSWDSNHFEAF